MRQLLAKLYAAFDTGDTADWEKGLAPDVLVIGTDEAEWWQGKDRVLTVLRAQTAEMHGAGMRLKRGEPEIAASGGAVWAADRPTMHLPDETEVPLRLTLLATQENGALVVRQMHLSVGAPNEEVLSQTLTV
jgi:SnoaL-like domain